MRIIKPLALTAVAIVAAMALSAGSAIAGSSQLCTVDSANDAACASGSEPMEVHFLSVNDKGIDAKEKWLIPALGLTIECNALFLAEASLGLKAGSPVVLTVPATNIIFSNCTSCSLSTIKGGTISLLRTGVELAEAAFTGFLILVDCAFFKCSYLAASAGHVLGALQVATSRAHITVVEGEDIIEGAGCPEIKLDALFASLTPLYIRP